MSRHPTDHRAPSGGNRMKRFAEVERASGQEGSHPAAQALNRRPASRAETNIKVEEFIRIERGQSA